MIGNVILNARPPIANDWWIVEAGKYCAIEIKHANIGNTRQIAGRNGDLIIVCCI